MLYTRAHSTRTIPPIMNHTVGQKALQEVGPAFDLTAADLAAEGMPECYVLEGIDCNQRYERMGTGLPSGSVIDLAGVLISLDLNQRKTVSCILPILNFAAFDAVLLR